MIVRNEGFSTPLELADVRAVAATLQTEDRCPLSLGLSSLLNTPTPSAIPSKRLLPQRFLKLFELRTWDEVGTTLGSLGPLPTDGRRPLTVFL